MSVDITDISADFRENLEILEGMFAGDDAAADRLPGIIWKMVQYREEEHDALIEFMEAIDSVCDFLRSWK